MTIIFDLSIPLPVMFYIDDVRREFCKWLQDILCDRDISVLEMGDHLRLSLPPFCKIKSESYGTYMLKKGVKIDVDAFAFGHDAYYNFAQVIVKEPTTEEKDAEHQVPFRTNREAVLNAINNFNRNVTFGYDVSTALNEFCRELGIELSGHRRTKGE